MSLSKPLKVTILLALIGLFVFTTIRIITSTNDLGFTPELEKQFNEKMALAETYRNIQLDSAQTYALEAHDIAVQGNSDYEKYRSLLLSAEIKFDQHGASQALYEVVKNYHEWFKKYDYCTEAFRCKYLEYNIKSFLRGWSNVSEERDSLIEAAKLCRDDKAMAHAYYFKMEKRNYSRAWSEDVHILDSARMFAQRSNDSVLLSKIRIMNTMPINGSKAAFDSIFISLSEANKWNSPTLKCSSYEALGMGFASSRKTDSALYYLQKGIQTSDRFGSKVKKMLSYQIVASAYVYAGNFDSLLVNSKIALQLAQDVGDKVGEQVLLKKIGIVWLNKEKYFKGIEYVKDALSIAEDLNDKEAIFSMQTFLLNFLIKSKRFDEAQHVISKMEKWVEQKDKTVVNDAYRCRLYFFAGAVNYYQGKYDSTLHYLEKGQNIYENQGHVNQFVIDNLMFSTYLKNNRLQEALEIQQLMEEKYSFNHPYRASFHSNKGELMYQLKKYTASIESLKRFLELTQDVVSEDIFDSHILLSKIYKEKGDFRKAFHHSEKGMLVKEKLEELNDAVKLEKIQSEHDLLVKESEISQLNVDRLKKENLLSAQTNKLQTRRTLIISLSALTVLLGIILFFLYNRSKEARLREALKRKALEKEKQLEQLKAEESKRSFELKNQLFTNISHEFRTPLALIQAPVEKLIERSTQEDKNDLMLVKRNSEHLLLMVDEILELSLLDSGNAKLTKKPFELNTFIHEVQTNFASLFRQKSVRFEVLLPTKNYTAVADEYRLKMVVNNLLKNAFQHTPKEGTIRLRVKAGDSLEFTLFNSGDWIDEAFLPSIFDRYARSSESEYAGYGIGLSFCKEIITLHGGEISAKNVNGGVVLSFSIPMELTAASSAKDVFPLDGETFETSTESIGERKNTLLIVEDNPEMQNLLKNLLTEKYRVLTADNGEEGINIAIQEQPDLIISDIMMPKVDGTELAKTLKEEFLTSHIPIILLTAKATDKDRIEGLEAGVDDYLTKPFSPKELAVRVKNLIQLRTRLRERFSKNIFLAPAEITPHSLDQEFLIKASKIIELNLLNPSFNVEFLCQELALNRNSVHQKLKSLTGQSASQFINAIRLKRSTNFLADERISILEVAELSGFNTSQSFNKVFKKQFEMTPSEYRKVLLENR